VKGGWKPFEACLLDLKAPPGSEHVGEKGVVMQQQWWAANGKSFQLLSLASELRTIIYEQAIGTQHLVGNIYQRDLRPLWFYGSGALMNIALPITLTFLMIT
jgi:hypothetical protein